MVIFKRAEFGHCVKFNRASEKKMNTYQAKRIPLGELLSRLGYAPHHTAKGEVWYLSPFRTEADASFKINTERNIWYDFGAGEGGNVLDFAMKYYRVGTIREALRALEELEGGARPAAPPPLPPAPSKAVEPVPEDAIQVSRVQPLQNRALIGYLSKRGIAAEIARPYVQEMHYTRSGKPYFALAFPNRSGGYELRNPYFKGVYGHKDISWVAGQDAQRAMVFEGFMDFLSALVHFKTPAPSMSVLVLNSVALRDKAADALRSAGITEAHLYLDHDPGGRELAVQLKGRLEGVNVIDQSGIYAGYKDFNAMLEQRSMA